MTKKKGLPKTKSPKLKKSILKVPKRYELTNLVN